MNKLQYRLIMMMKIIRLTTIRFLIKHSKMEMTTIPPRVITGIHILRLQSMRAEVTIIPPWVIMGIHILHLQKTRVEATTILPRVIMGIRILHLQNTRVTIIPTREIRILLQNTKVIIVTPIPPHMQLINSIPPQPPQ